jgi:hypothetical protein
MRIRRWGWAFLPIVAWGLAGIAACVGDDPAIGPVAVDDSGRSDTGTDAGGPLQDAASDSALPPPADAAITCAPVAPQLFQAFPGQGTFCQGAQNNHCAFGEHCCKDLTLNTQRCAASCDAGVADLECANTTECGDSGVCCGRGKVRTDLCTYLVVEDFLRTSCETSCVGPDFQLCSGNADCNDGGKTCTPARVLTTDNKATSSVQVSACR